LRETLLKKGSPSNSLPKTFSFKFFPDRALLKYYKPCNSFGERPVREKFGLKVFGKGFGGEPFLRKVSPDKSNGHPKAAMLRRGNNVIQKGKNKYETRYGRSA
jgi:hypothetical protein